MDYKILGVMLVLLVAMTGMAFAADPVITGETTIVDPDIYVGTDYTYFGVNPTVQSGVVTDADLDLNILGGLYTLYDTNGDNSFTWSAADWNADVNRFQVTFSSSSMYDDYNFNFRAVDDADNDTNGLPLYVWYDQNAPTSAQTNVEGYGVTTVTIAATDSATWTGNGSGVATYYYSVDSGTWQSNTTGTVSIGGGPGTHTLAYYAVDNLDNNEMAEAALGLNTDNITVTRGGITAGTCNLINLMILVLVGALIVGIVGLMATGNLNVNTIMPVAITAIAFIIIIFIAASVNGVTCVV